MTPQKIYDTVKAHLIKQGRRAYSIVDSGCSYRTSNGFKCAVGCLIPDELYTDEMEGVLVVNLIHAYKDVLPEWFCLNEVLLGRLQVVHDYQHNWSSSDGFVGFSALYAVAHDFKLTP